MSFVYPLIVIKHWALCLLPWQRPGPFIFMIRLPAGLRYISSNLREDHIPGGLSIQMPTVLQKLNLLDRLQLPDPKFLEPKQHAGAEAVENDGL